MIYEYALDPSLVARWAAERERIGVMCVRQFGMDQMRLVSDFPKDWRHRVWGEFYKRFDDDNSSLEFQNAQRDLDTYLQILTDYMVPRTKTMPLDADWSTEAIQEHAKRPFHAIFSSKEMDDAPKALITEAVLSNIHDPRWYLPTIERTPKSATGIAQALGPLLRVASQIFLIDPNFRAEKPRFRDTFIAILEKAFSLDRVFCTIPEITVITGVDRVHKDKEGEWTLKQLASAADDICVKAQQYLPRQITRGVNVKLVVLKNPVGGDPLHNRYVLTDVGGVIVPYGLDEYTKGENHSAKDDLIPLKKGGYEDLWKQYAKSESSNVVRGPESIIGTK